MAAGRYKRIKYKSFVRVNDEISTLRKNVVQRNSAGNIKKIQWLKTRESLIKTTHLEIHLNLSLVFNKSQTGQMLSSLNQIQ